MQTKSDLEKKYSNVLNELLREQKRTEHYAKLADFHISKSKYRGRKIHAERLYHKSRKQGVVRSLVGRFFSMATFPFSF